MIRPITWVEILKRYRTTLRFSLMTQQRIAWGLLVLLMLFYAIWISDQTILRYDTFKATGFDLGNMSQATWNTLHGRPFEFTNHADNWYGAPIRLAQHVEPIFFLLSGLYVFGADPRILLVFQTLAMAAGALPVFLLTKRFLPTLPLIASFLSAGYLFAPALIGQNLFDFHPVTLATPLFLYAVLALTYRRYVWCVIACILAAACKEEMPAVVALFGLLVIWKYKQPRLGALLFIGGMAWSLFAFLVVMPHFNVGAQTNNYWYRYEALGSSPSAAIINVILQPWLPFTVFLTMDRIYYLASLMRSTGFLTLLAPEWLLPTLPSLAINLLTSEPFQHSGVYHYNAAIIAFFTLAAIHGARRLFLFWYGLREEDVEAQLYLEHNVLGHDSHKPGKSLPGLNMLFNALRVLWLLIRNMFARLAHLPLVYPLALRVMKYGRMRWSGMRIQASGVASIISVPNLQKIVVVWIGMMIVLNYIIMTPQLNIFWADHRVGAREQQIEQLLKLIPADAAVSAGGTLNPHLTARRYLTVFPEITVAALGDEEERLVDYIIVDLDKVSPENVDFAPNFIDVLNQIQRSGQFKPIAQADGVILLQRVKP